MAIQIPEIPLTILGEKEKISFNNPIIDLIPLKTEYLTINPVYKSDLRGEQT
jgi:hypothetical protein